MLLADGEWELAADTGEGNKRDWSQEKRDVGASRGFITLPGGGWDSRRETYRTETYIGIPIRDQFQCVPLRHKSSAQTRNLLTRCWQEGLRSWPVAGSLCWPEALCSQLDP